MHYWCIIFSAERAHYEATCPLDGMKLRRGHCMPHRFIVCSKKNTKQTQCLKSVSKSLLTGKCENVKQAKEHCATTKKSILTKGWRINHELRSSSCSSLAAASGQHQGVTNHLQLPRSIWIIAQDFNHKEIFWLENKNSFHKWLCVSSLMLNIVATINVTLFGGWWAQKNRTRCLGKNLWCYFYNFPVTWRQSHHCHGNGHRNAYYPICSVFLFIFFAALSKHIIMHA